MKEISRAGKSTVEPRVVEDGSEDGIIIQGTEGVAEDEQPWRGVGSFGSQGITISSGSPGLKLQRGDHIPLDDMADAGIGGVVKTVTHRIDYTSK